MSGFAGVMAGIKRSLTGNHVVNFVYTGAQQYWQRLDNH